MAARWIALVLGLITLTIVGFFVAVALSPRQEPTIAADRGQAFGPEPRRMTSRPWIVSADLAWLQTGMEVTLTLRGDGGRAVGAVSPKAELRMLEMAMAPVPLALVPLSPGRWRGAGPVSMQGRWSLVVTVEGEELAFPFTAPGT